MHCVIKNKDKVNLTDITFLPQNIFELNVILKIKFYMYANFKLVLNTRLNKTILLKKLIFIKRS